MISFLKGKKIYSILLCKCPRCHEGNLFLVKNPYKLRTLDKMPKRCPVCDLDFVRETGFYYGAMMMSHALTTIIAVIIHFIVFYFWGWEILPHLVFLITIILALFPINFRIARALWINLFVIYDPKTGKDLSL
ncbi:MAG: DUF983 domain-containing protein [Bacteroidetes bacterium]|nr:DUF983 domain-containing protein [Bacteroidota bacterium]